MWSPAPFTFTQVTALAISARTWLDFEGKNVVILLSVLTDKKNEQTLL